MGAKGYDATGKEHELPTAVKDLTVTDESGVARKIVAGTPVPLDLLDAYNEAKVAEQPDPPGDAEAAAKPAKRRPREDSDT